MGRGDGGAKKMFEGASEWGGRGREGEGGGGRGRGGNFFWMSIALLKHFVQGIKKIDTAEGEGRWEVA